MEMENELQIYMGLDVSSKPVTVHLYTCTLKVEYQDEDLALYTVAWHEDNKRITEVTNPRVIETCYRSPQFTRFPTRSRRMVALQEVA